MTRYTSRYYDPPVRFRDVITRADIDALAQSGQSAMTLGAQSTITDEAREHALKLGITIQSEGQKPKAAAAAAPRAPSVPSTPLAPPPVAPAAAPTARPAPFPAPPRSATQSSSASTTPAAIVEAVVAELHVRRITPSVPLIQKIVTGVNAALASDKR